MRPCKHTQLTWRLGLVAGTAWAQTVLPGQHKPSRPHTPETTAILGPFTATLQKYVRLHKLSKHNSNKPNVRERL